ncbi:MAG: PLP-dependent cysteine synthase family protein [Myxococcales bacterium]|nr:PLP-dependent cysteine synthase family protein [Myxococcales bacterium]
MLRPRRLDSILDAVGNTPLLRLRTLERETPGVSLYAKVEFANPGGSVKDRAARQIFLDAIARGELTRDKILIDSTSGNTGVAYSMVGAALGYRVALVMPSNVSQARKDITRAYGTELIFSNPLEGSDGAIRHVREVVADDPDRFYYPDQYSNLSNPRAHYLGTGVEILRDVGDRITHFVAGLGTTGTFVGTTRRLREHHRRVRCVAVEPAEQLHGLEGLKHLASSLVPPIYDPSLVDETRFVSTDDGWDMTDRLTAEDGLFLGHSAGANVFAALSIGRELAARGETGCIVTVLCDRGDRYFAPMRWEKRYLW